MKFALYCYTAKLGNSFSFCSALPAILGPFRTRYEDWFDFCVGCVYNPGNGRNRILVKAKLNNIRIVLVGIRNTGNIGSAARAMKNMGMTELVLVNPKPYDTPEVYRLGWGAEDIIRNARVCKTITEAVSDCGLVVGTTRRKGRLRRPINDLPQGIPKIALATRRSRVAILFGREDKGLSNEELALCQLALKITSSKRSPSLNVAQSVMLVCYEIFKFAISDQVEQPQKFVAQSELWKLYSRLEQAMATIGYGNKGDRKVLNSVMRTLRRIFGRSGLAKDELRALHGICQQIEKYAKEENN